MRIKLILRRKIRRKKLPIRLMVGHIPLEDVIGVRVPDRQLTSETRQMPIENAGGTFVGDSKRLPALLKKERQPVLNM